MASGAEDLAAVLEDTQASLGTALARIEAHRLREGLLLAQVSRLRAQLRAQGVQPEEPDPSPRFGRSRSPSPTRSPRGRALGDREVEDHLGSDGGQYIDAYLANGAEERPVVLYTEAGEVAASLITTPAWIGILEHKARIGAGEIVGMSTLDNNPKPGLGSKPSPNSWMNYFFGQKKGRQEFSRPSAPVQIPRPAPSSADAEPHSGYDSAPEAEDRPSRFQWFFERHPANTRVKKTKGDRADAHSDGGDDEPCNSTGVCQVLWKDGGGTGQLKRAVFESSVATQAHLHQHIESWSDAAARNAALRNVPNLNGSAQNEDSRPDETRHKGSPSASPPEERKPTGEEGELVLPMHLMPTGSLPSLNQPSVLLLEQHLTGIMAAVPKRMQQANWELLYSTTKHGFSLQSLYRKSAGAAPTVLVIKDQAEHVFGAYCSEAWKIAPRFYGTGESFVFQLEPHRVYYPWKRKHSVRNDFFMFGSQDSIGVGGTGHFAIWVDGELLYGHSGVCDTFGSPCLASKDEFKVIALELWGLA